jgi:hypothetical protein
MPTRRRDYALRHQINKQAWDEALEHAKFYYDIRKAELLEDHGLETLRSKRHARRAADTRTKQFRAFILSCLADDTLALNDDFLDAIEPFLRQSTTSNRVILTKVLKENPSWLGDRLAEFLKFA